MGYCDFILWKSRRIPINHSNDCNGWNYDAFFGSIAVVGMNTLIRGKVDVTEARNLCIISVVMTFGIGNMFVDVGNVSLKVSACARLLLSS